VLILAAFALAAIANPLPEPGDSDATVLMGPALFEPALPLPPEVLEALGQREHSKAFSALNAIDPLNFTGPQASDLGFLKAWTLIRSKRADEAQPFLGHIEHSTTAPDSHRWLTVGELHLAVGDLHKAARSFQRIDPSDPMGARAKLQLAAAHKKAGATKSAMDLYAELADRSDPVSGGEIALWALAQKRGLSNPTAKPWLRRLWIHYPLSAAAKQANAALKSHHGEPSIDDYGARSIRLMELGAWTSVTGTVSPRLSQFSLKTALGCEVRYAYGRSLFKRNQVTNAAAVLVPVGTLCADLAPSSGAKALYIAGKSLERKKAWAQAAEAYQKIPELYPDHTMADDGFALGGIAWIEAGNKARALQLWEQQADRYPTGDMAGEGFWRLAWSAYQAGDASKAIDVAERMVREVPLHIDPVHVMGGRYWAARWRLYPDVANPELISPDEEAVTTGIDQLVNLVSDRPAGFYSLLAAARLAELAPDRLAALSHPAPAQTGTTWTVRKSFMQHPATDRGLRLARLGLIQEAMAEFGLLGRDLTPSETAVITQIQAKAEPYRAHDRLHRSLLHHPPSTLGPDRDRIMLAALPNHYFDTIESVTTGYSFDPRIFHALVREESSFNKDIRSWAGARGLSQLMPATGRRVAGWLGLKVTTAQLTDPKTNLAIGSRYLNYLFEHFDGNPFLAVAGYNAGEGNVGKWVTRFGNIPTDEFIEHIPFRETRHYVKRVLGTYQSYRVIRGPDTAPPTWAHTNHRVVAD
jgi:soluble lytic murein transglycosylase